MPQKYKVFIDKHVIHFTSEKIPIVEIIEKVPSMNEHSLLGLFKTDEAQVVNSNPKRQIKSFFSDFKKLKTAGGLVHHLPTDSFLWIKRFDLWDLPKGKIEKGESSKEAAIREIREECGLRGEITLIKRICSTYHVYSTKNNSILKKNNWYYLNYDGDLSTIPQEEEGISAVHWINRKDMDQCLNETYPSIRELLNKFFES